MATASASQRYFPNLKDVVPYHAEVEIRQLRSMIYDLLDAKPQVLDYTLSAAIRVDTKLVKGRPVFVIARQDATGGWAIQWATNADGSLKFKGTSLVTVTTTANTYTAYLFIATSETEAMLVGHETGGNLS